MKRRIGTVLAVCALLLPLASCKFLSGPDYELIITVEAGVAGSPASGVYSYKDLSEVDYAYTPQNAQHTVEAVIDGARSKAEDTLTVYHRTTLVARVIDIRGTWNVTSYDTDAKETTFDLTFSGADVLGGTFSDSRGYSGTWSGAANELVITYGNWEAYVYSGTLFNMGGTWANGSAAGTWSASRAN